jgi:hypothetical protein
MGITRNCVQFLTYSKQKDVSFEHTLMLGRQQLFVSEDEIRSMQEKFGLSGKFSNRDNYAEPLFELLGASRVDSLDYSSFEKATIIHNLNVPIPPSLKAAYSVVFDGGTLEHVFNFPVALKNCMDALRIGGHFLCITPANNQCGHGFYQFSPELFYSLFTPAHGFKTKLVAIAVEHPERGIQEWYSVANPHDIKKRITLVNSFPTYLMVIAEKVADTDRIELNPFQSDYQYIWEVFTAMHEDQPRQNESKMLHLYRKFTPNVLKRIVRNLIGRENGSTHEIPGLGSVNEKYFKKMVL